MAGRPQGSTNLPKIRDYIDKDQIEKLVNLCLKSAFEKKDITMQKFLVEQLFGKAPQTMDLTSGGEKIIPLLNYVRNNNSDNKNTDNDEKDKSNTRGDISK